MAARMVGDFQVTGCEKCGGLFVAHETFETIQDTSQRVIETGEITKPARMAIEKKIAYVRCPMCRTMMNRKNFAQVSGVIVDVCGYHGTWFDGGELEKIMDFIAHGGLQKARAREEERLKDQEILARLRAEEVMDRGMSRSHLTPEYQLEGMDEGLIDVLSKAFSLFKR
jgi:Zn-finger nucleic acid-binding protein